MSANVQHLMVISAVDDPIANVIFVHGLSGDQSDSWRCGTSDELWPSWLNERFPGLAVHSFGYAASVFAKNEQDLFERATSALDLFASKGFGKCPLILVGHSLGGLLIKSILRKSRETSDQGLTAVADATRLVVFIATPHTGASLASIGKFVLPHFTSDKIEILANKAGILDDLKQAYRDFVDKKSDLQTVVYYEKLNTHSQLIVDRDSSDPGVAKVTPVAVDKNHISICKPDTRDDQVFLGLVRHIGVLIDDWASTSDDSYEPFATVDFSIPSDRDRRELLVKMIDANRENEYSIANEYQNHFAQNYYKLGLMTSARTNHDRILADVEQRFHTNVYLKLICKGANDDAIQSALQADVIDPICQKYTDIPSLTGLTVLQALYFLTEQCRVRWDAE
jgi:protein SERAC1